MKGRRPDADIVRAIDRVSAEGPVPLAQLAGQPLMINGVLVRPTGAVLLRWGQQGKAGVYLDVCYVRRLAGWCTSYQPLARFAEELAEKVRAPVAN